MLTEIFLKVPFSVRSLFSCDDLSSTAGQMRKNYLFAGGFRDDFTESQPAFCKYCVQLAAGIQSAVLIANIQIQIVYTYASLAADARVEDSNLDIHLRNKGKIIFQ